MLELTASDLRKFCAKKAFRIGAAFPDSTLEGWLRSAEIRAARERFRRESNKRRWILAFAARECCESQSQGPDRVGYALRASHAPVFTGLMRRNLC